MSATIKVSDLVSALTKLAGESESSEPVKTDPWAGLIGPDQTPEAPEEPAGEPDEAEEPETDECTCTCHKSDEDAGSF